MTAENKGLVVDYIVIMGYDEHYVGSDAGSVASLPWVEQGVQDTIAEAPAAKNSSCNSCFIQDFGNNVVGL